MYGSIRFKLDEVLLSKYKLILENIVRVALSPDCLKSYNVHF